MKAVTTRDFLDELQYEVRSMNEFGTPYRQVTASLSLEVAKTQSNVMQFRSRENAFKVAQQVLKEADFYRLQDVAQMLQSLLWSMERKQNRSDEKKKEFKERAKNFKLVSV